MSYFACESLAGLEALEPRTLMAGLTIATHGYQANGDEPGWLGGMTQAIRDRIGDEADSVNARLFFNEDTYFSSVLQGTVNPRLASDAEVVARLDWADASNNGLSDPSPFVHSSSVADSLRYFLETDESGSDLLGLPIHLIGHSRGGSVMAETARSLGEMGIWIHQLTLLDPRPVSHDPALPGVPDNVLYADNYYQTNDVLINGQFVAGARNSYLVGAPGPAIGHSQVHAYYHGTIEAAAAAQPGGGAISEQWYSGGVFGPRSQVGFNVSRIGGLDISEDFAHWPFTGGPEHVPVGYASEQWPNAIVGATQTSVVSGAALGLSVVYGDRDSGMSIQFSLDDDENPFNGYRQVLTTRDFSQVDIANDQFSVSTTGTSAGEYRVLAIVSDGSRTRYAYGEAPITVTPPPSAAHAEASVNATQLFATVRYTANTGMSWGSLDNADVELRGPGGLVIPGTLTSQVVNPASTITATYAFTARGGTWDSTDNGNYELWLRPNQVWDNLGNAVGTQGLRTYSLYFNNPTAERVSEAVVDGGMFMDVAIRYTDAAGSPLGISWGSIGNGDVELSGPSGFLGQGVLLSSTIPVPGQLIATYRFNARGGAWDHSDNGSYTLRTRLNQVFDNQGYVVPVMDLRTYGLFFNSPAVNPVATDVANGRADMLVAVTYRASGSTLMSWGSFTDGDDLSLSGPGGYSGISSLVSRLYNAANNTYTVTYRFVGPGGTWNSADNGQYILRTRPSEVLDALGRPVTVFDLATYNLFF